MNEVRNRIEKRTYKRYVLSFCLFLVVAAVVVGKLAGYQLKEYEYYQNQVLNQVTTEYDVNPERGEITDRNGVPYTTATEIFWLPISRSTTWFSLPRTFTREWKKMRTR